MTDGVLSEQTCGPSCWRAKEDLCHCSCEGRNHGCLKQEYDADGNALPRPPRQMRKYGHMYQLHSIHKDGGSAWAAKRDFIKLHPVTVQGVYHGRSYVREGEAAFDQHATTAQMKWDELKALVDPEHAWRRPYLVWARLDLLADEEDPA